MKILFICNAHWIFPALMQHFSTAAPAELLLPPCCSGAKSQRAQAAAHGERPGSEELFPWPESHPKARGCGPDIPKFIPSVEQGEEISQLCDGVTGVKQ